MVKFALLQQHNLCSKSMITTTQYNTDELLISCSMAVNPVGRNSIVSMMHDHCDAMLMDNKGTSEPIRIFGWLEIKGWMLLKRYSEQN